VLLAYLFGVFAAPAPPATSAEVTREGELLLALPRAMPLKAAVEVAAETVADGAVEVVILGLAMCGSSTAIRRNLS
jgi:hypothetical protein